MIHTVTSLSFVYEPLEGILRVDTDSVRSFIVDRAVVERESLEMMMHEERECQQLWRWKSCRYFFVFEAWKLDPVKVVSNLML